MLRIISFSFWFLFHPVHVIITSIDFIPEMIIVKINEFEEGMKLTADLTEQTLNIV